MTAEPKGFIDFTLIHSGNEEAFTALFRRHYGSLMVYAMKFLPPTEAEDIVSDSFIKLWRERMQFNAEPQAYAWMRTTVRNAAIDLLRRQQRQSGTLQELLQQSNGQVTDEQDNAALEASVLQKISTSIKGLPPRQQEILRMFFFDGLDNAAIASALDISLQAVKNQKVTALKSLRRLFTREELSIYLLLTVGAQASLSN